MNFEDELLQDAEDDRLTVEFIKNYLPQELKEKFSDEQLYYLLDVLVEYYAESGILEAEPDKDGYIDIDVEQIAEHLAQQARKDQMGDFSPEDLRWWLKARWSTPNPWTARNKRGTTPCPYHYNAPPRFRAVHCLYMQSDYRT